MASDFPFSLRPTRPSELRAIVAIDDAASELYATAGLAITLTADHPFVLAEVERWGRAIELGLAQVAVDAQGELAGFMTLGFVDGAPYLDQIAVHPRAMRCGIGSAFVRQAVSWSGARALWLTTYAHLPWNRSFYERHGFAVVPEVRFGSELKRVLESQRAALPDPEQRIAMVRRADPQASQ